LTSRPPNERGRNRNRSERTWRRVRTGR
jgi:hypothetical protein